MLATLHAVLKPWMLADIDLFLPIIEPSAAVRRAVPQILPLYLMLHTLMHICQVACRYNLLSRMQVQ